MTVSDLDVSVVICAYTEDRWHDLLAAIESVRVQAAPRAREIIVVVDHNPRLFERVVADIAGVVAVPNTRVKGLGGARNSGVAAAQGEVVAFIDDDALAAPDWLRWLAAGYGEPGVMGVGGSIEPLWYGARPGWFPEEFDWVVGCSYRGLPRTQAPVRNLFGCNMSYRRELFASVGGFSLGYGCDETEFCIRAQRQWPDRVLLYEPRARVQHRVPASRATWRYFLRRCFFEGRSKAVVSWLQGRRDGLASERAHTLRTLPSGVLGGLADGIIRRDPDGLGRAVAIVGGLAVTASGYVSGSLAVAEAARERGWVQEQPLAVSR